MTKMREGIIKEDVENKGIREWDEEENLFKRLNAVKENED